MREARLFVAITNLQLLAIDDVRTALGPPSGLDVLLAFGDRSAAAGMPPFDEVIRYYRRAESLGDKIRGIGMTKRAIERAVEICQASDAVQVFYPHENHLVPNYLVNYLPSRLPPHVLVRYHVIPDGTLNVSSWRVSPSMQARNIGKKALMRAIGLDFRLFRGEVLAGRLDRVTSYYAYAPEMAWCDRSKVVPLRHRLQLAGPTNPDQCLILGQPLEYTIGKERAVDLAKGLLQYVGTRSYRQIFYRGHQFASVMDDVYAGSAEVTPADRSGTVESLLQGGGFRPRDVYSFSSSALQNLMMFFPGHFRCHAYGLDSIKRVSHANRRMHEDIEQAFKAYGVQIISHDR